MGLGGGDLGASGLVKAGVGLGGTGLEGGAAAPAGDPDITDYSLTVAEGSCTLVGNNHLTPYLSLSGDRVYWARGSSFQSFQYELTTPGDLSTLTGNFEGVQNWRFLSQFMFSIALTPDRTKAYKIRVSGSDEIFISADPFSAAALGDPAVTPYQLLNTKNSSNLGGTPVRPGSFVVMPNNLDVFIASKNTDFPQSDRKIYHHQMSVAGDASTITLQGEALDLSSVFSNLIYGIFYTPDGSKLFVLGDDGGTIKDHQWDLSPAYDVNSAVDSGKEITVTPAHFAQISSNLSITVWANPVGGFKLYLTYHDADNFNNTAMEFDQYDAP